MGNISSLHSGESFKIVEKKLKGSPSVDPSKMTIGQTNQYLDEKQMKKAQIEINGVKDNFKDRYDHNGKVELLVEGIDGVAVVQDTGNGISLHELAAQGGALTHFALTLKKYDENNDYIITEDELFTSWGEQLGESALTIGGATAAGAATGSTIGAMGGTVVVPGVGTAVGWLGMGALGAAIGGIGSTVWEGVRAIGYAASDEYHTDQAR